MPSLTPVASLPVPAGSPVPRETLLVVVLVACFALPFPHFPFLKSPNELSRLYQVRALVDDGTPAVNGPVSRYGHVGDLSKREGRLYPNKAPGVSYMGAPVYAALRWWKGGQENVSNDALLWWLRFLVCGLPTALVAPRLRRAAARFSGDTRAADAAIVVWALGTLAYPYGLLFFSHGPSALLLVSAWLVVSHGGQDPGEARRALSGALAAMAVCTEYTTAPVAVMVAAYGAWRSNRPVFSLFSVALGALPFAAALGAYHQVAWGHPLKTGYAFVENKTFESWHAQGFMGVTTPSPLALANHLFHPSRGLFAWSPALLLAAPGLWWFFRRSARDAWMALGVTGFYLFLASAFLYEAWGWMLGPRHLTPLVPFLVVPLAIAIARLRETDATDVPSSLAVGAVAASAGASVLVTSIASTAWPHIPEEFSAAWAHLVWPLLRDGRWPPDTLGTFAALPGHAGLVATWLLLASLAAWTVMRVLPKPRNGARIAGLVGGLVVFAAYLAFAHPGPTDRERGTVRWIEGQWPGAK